MGTFNTECQAEFTFDSFSFKEVNNQPMKLVATLN